MNDRKIVDAKNTFCPGPLMELIASMKQAEVSTEAAEESAGGIVGVYKTMTNAEVQTALAVVGRITEAYRR